MSSPHAQGAGPRKAQEIFDATLELLAEHGYDGLTIEAVARRAEVNKTTIYRWWSSKDQLIVSALIDSRALEFDVPDTGSLRGDLQSLAAQIARLLTVSPSAQIASLALSADPRRPELATLFRAFFADRMAREEPIFERARARGELEPGTDPSMVMDLLAGAVWFRVLLRSGSASPDYLAEIVEMVLRAVQPVRD
ncbi:TetR/AcrR family transcriptional regulator [Nocardia sp. NPDC051832]|uniref:TetR/AcrR family transcriptional regulator n=1 Tax=Nocardia sp. NPDC051832 TaxID=3155673 RepID=UPI003440A49F